ncbi:hypothetical protein NGM33_18375 [Nocardiopsis dassonvillei]|uniref:hypothetical protein n=1 Tax=Nocardiopsis dassonvillei TaxID=2014 RepID=UPI00102C9817|nr:hypothetical protein [Nocardiopsis dassonvillei]MCP3015296.1 hypothetical protein [Nocardiopsis dassonvillei]
MRTITRGRIDRLLASGALSLVAAFGLAACDDGAAEEGDTVESQEMSEEPMEDGASEEPMEEEMSDESMEEGMSEEPVEEMSEESMQEDMEMEDDGM